MQVHGACLCGAVQFEAVVDPARVTICHCTDCQTLTGTAYRVTVAASAEGFRLARGSPKTYIKEAQSGSKRAQVFCAECGSHLYAHAAVENPDRFGLRVGCLHERTELVPSKRIWCRSALAWSENLQGLQTVDQE
ncbi:MAG: GFA family protein [Pseudomonadota bacterium]|nr:GFA family protein [Pseudomonadota bacterium]